MDLESLIQKYLNYCEQRSLDDETLKAYRVDLFQFSRRIGDTSTFTQDILEDFITYLQQTYKPSTVKRKVASLKVFFHYLERKQLIEESPFHKMQLSFSMPETVPKTLPFSVVTELLSIVNKQSSEANTVFKRRMALRDFAIVQLLFKTGIRISELCSLVPEEVDLENGIISLSGKGLRNRKLKIEESVWKTLQDYYREFQKEIIVCGHFFVNRNQGALSDQVVRRMIQKYVSLGSSELKVTPNMLRNTLATYLLDSGEGIHYVQQLFGHSSISVTERYNSSLQESFTAIPTPSL